jgi:hypothetical protein
MTPLSNPFEKSLQSMAPKIIVGSRPLLVRLQKLLKSFANQLGEAQVLLHRDVLEEP